MDICGTKFALYPTRVHVRNNITFIQDRKFVLNPIRVHVRNNTTVIQDWWNRLSSMWIYVGQSPCSKQHNNYTELNKQRFLDVDTCGPKFALNPMRVHVRNNITVIVRHCVHFPEGWVPYKKCIAFHIWFHWQFSVTLYVFLFLFFLTLCKSSKSVW